MILFLIEAQATGVPCVFSDVVPDEANVLMDNNKKVSLKQSPELWSQAILNCKNKRELNPHEKIANGGYDITVEAKKLEQYYMNMCK